MTNELSLSEFILECDMKGIRHFQLANCAVDYETNLEESLYPICKVWNLSNTEEFPLVWKFYYCVINVSRIPEIIKDLDEYKVIKRIDQHSDGKTYTVHKCRNDVWTLYYHQFDLHPLTDHRFKIFKDGIQNLGYKHKFTCKILEEYQNLMRENGRRT